jgi:eukaryotic-like serine/threonine-protein kinase
MIGKTVSHYRIVEKLGEGGMGVVYLAEDTHLGRRVAIKFLTAIHDHNYRARFLREARAISTLSHPHIAILHDYGETTEGQPFIVMEYVRGKTLNDLLHESAVTLSRALDIAEAVADALSSAHAQGIVHRDIKPSNVIVDEAGRVKVLDFGLAKQLHEDPPHDANPDAATLPAMQTSSNVVVGTPLYLSPEQAMGAAVDARSDLFALGALLYESLTGKAAFSGGSVIEIGAQIIHVHPPAPSSINPRVPAELDRITLKALEKKAAARYQTAAELLGDLRAVRTVLTDADDLHHTQRLQPPRTEHSSALQSISDTLRRPRVSIGVFLVGMILLALILWLLFIQFNKTAVTPFERMKVTRLTNTGKSVGATISPDGKYVVYVSEESGPQSLWLRHVPTTTNTQIIPPGEGQYSGLTFSQDSNYLYYVHQSNEVSSLYRRGVLGGTSQKLLTNVDSTPSVSPDGKQLAFVRLRKTEGEYDLVVARSDGTDEHTLATRKQGEFFSLFGGTAWSPDGKTIACAAGSYSGGYHMNLIGVRVENGAEKPIASPGWFQIIQVAWQSNGRGLILAASEQAISPFQIWYLSYPEGKARRITNDLTDYNDIALTADSRNLVTVQADSLTSIWVTTNSDPAQARQITSGVGHTHGVSWTPDSKILFSSVSSGDLDVWRMEPDGNGKVQLTANSGANYYPVSSPDGRYIVFASNRNGPFNIWRMDVDGSNPRQLTNGGTDVNPCFSPDGQWIVYESFRTGLPVLWKISTAGGAAIQLTTVYSSQPTVSPDGKTVACRFLDTKTDTQKIALIRLDDGQVLRTLNIPIHFWQRIRWSLDGRSLTYTDVREGTANIWSQPVDGSAPRQLTDFKSDLIFSYDWSRDGNRLTCERGTETSDVVLITDTVE